MNSRLFLIPAILATTAAFGDSADVLSARLDAHAQAAALVSGSRIVVKGSRSNETIETLGQHPAVLVAQKWSTRSIDPNTFIVAHPARLQLLAAADPDNDQGAEIAGRSASAR